MKHILEELLTRPISELGCPKRAIHAKADLSIQGAVATLKSSHIGSIVIVDGLRVIGIFTERDFLERVGFSQVDISRATVGEFMTPNPICAQRFENIGSVLKKMREGNFRHIVIVDAYGNLEKVVSMREIMDYLVVGSVQQAA
jgi:CBS domain-containing protein